MFLFSGEYIYWATEIKTGEKIQFTSHKVFEIGEKISNSKGHVYVITDWTF